MSTEQITYRHITAPECRQYLLRQAFEEAIYTHAYQHIVESLGLDEKEIFNAYNEIPSICDMDQFLIPFIEVINDPEFKTGPLEADQKLLKSILALPSSVAKKAGSDVCERAIMVHIVYIYRP